MDCVFCKIINKTIKSEIIHDDNECIAFNDMDPQAPVHFLVVPKKHISTLLDINKEDEKLIGHMVSVANKICEDKQIDLRGFRLIFNCNPDSGQIIYHIHLHVLGGRKMHWPPG